MQEVLSVGQSICEGLPFYRAYGKKTGFVWLCIAGCYCTRTSDAACSVLLYELVLSKLVTCQALFLLLS